MKKAHTAPSVSKGAAFSVIALVVFLALLVFLIVQQVNFLVGRSLLVAFGDADSTYRGAWFELDGDLVAKDFSIKSDDPAVPASITFERLHVETPGWGWVIGTIFDSEQLIADVGRLHVTLTGGTSDGGYDPTLGDLGPFGTDTASPFEAEGCLNDNVWIRSELVTMGLTPGPTTLEYDYQIVSQKLTTRIVLDTPGVSKVELVRQETVPEGAHPYLLDITPTEATSERWLVTDQGFVKARNAWCAKDAGIEVAQFVQRHVDSVQRVLATRGLAADTASVAMYTRFASDGGELRFGGDYYKPLPSDAFYDARDLGLAMLGMNGILSHGDKRLPVQWSRFTPMPLPAPELAITTYAALAKERGQGLAAPVPLPAAQVPMPVAAPAAKPAVAALAATPVARAAVPAPAPAPVKRGTVVPWEQLGDYIGHEFEIRTGRSPPRIVTVNEAGANEIHVEGSVQGGHVKYRINREGFTRAVFIR